MWLTILDTNKCSVYNVFKDKVLEVHIMDNEKEEYREKIIEMVKKIENIDWLKFIHRLITNLLK